MNRSDIERIESALKLVLPDSYRKLVSDYPYTECGDLCEFGLFANADRVIEANLDHREQGWFAIDWPPHYFVIGDTGCGDTYFMVIGKDEAVYLADHEQGPDPLSELEGCRRSETLAAHVETQHQGALELELDLAAEALAKRERKTRKKWYQFWI